ncbi:hypothetical protein B0T17DRAFT_625602 [Bombardia bombarda]|uniref:Uncharacterized protein n=1 Tax=Bombardia bombarda TaxID=252184 RepID=A0AA39XLH1_9PEZI|nr:hypothetical protein B0T17DRAFT_625602 [Bombardia bombarda]
MFYQWAAPEWLPPLGSSHRVGAGKDERSQEGKAWSGALMSLVGLAARSVGAGCICKLLLSPWLSEQRSATSLSLADAQAFGTRDRPMRLDGEVERVVWFRNSASPYAAIGGAGRWKRGDAREAVAIASFTRLGTQADPGINAVDDVALAVPLKVSRIPEFQFSFLTHTPRGRCGNGGCTKPGVCMEAPEGGCARFQPAVVLWVLSRAPTVPESQSPIVCPAGPLLCLSFRHFCMRPEDATPEPRPRALDHRPGSPPQPAMAQ